MLILCYVILLCYVMQPNSLYEGKMCEGCEVIKGIPKRKKKGVNPLPANV